MGRAAEHRHQLQIPGEPTFIGQTLSLITKLSFSRLIENIFKCYLCISAYTSGEKHAMNVFSPEKFGSILEYGIAQF